MLNLSWLVATALVVGQANSDETLRYRRFLPTGTAPECVFTLQTEKNGRTISSVTHRGTSSLTVTAQFDPKDRLVNAQAALTQGDRENMVRVKVEAGRAIVQREGKDTQSFEIPERVIVTSAPDWSDTFLLCRGYDFSKGGKQEMPGLWIHPELPAQRLTFAVERAGADSIDHEGKKLVVNRLLLQIRNNSRYAAWTDESGRMIRLVSLPFKENAGTNLVLEGFEKSAANLRPPPP